MDVLYQENPRLNSGMKDSQAIIAIKNACLLCPHTKSRYLMMQAYAINRLVSMRNSFYRFSPLNSLCEPYSILKSNPIKPFPVNVRPNFATRKITQSLCFRRLQKIKHYLSLYFCRCQFTVAGLCTYENSAFQ